MEENKLLEVCASYPGKFAFSDSELQFDGTPIANCAPVVKAVKKLVGNKRPETVITVGAILADGTEVPETNVLLHELNFFDIQANLDSRCYAYPGKTQNLIQNLIRGLAAKKRPPRFM